MKVYITPVEVGEPRGKTTTRPMRKQLTQSYWAEHYTYENIFTLPNRLAFVGNQDDFGFDLASDNELKVVINCDLKFNQLVNFKMQVEGISREQELSFKTLFTACWLTLFQQFNYNPMKSLVKEQSRTYVKEFEYMTKFPSDIRAVGLMINNRQLNEKVGCSWKELGLLFQSMRYLAFVDFFKDNDPLKWTSVAPIFDDFKSYDKFMDNVVNKETRVKADYDFSKKLYNNTKTYLNRAVESGILIRGGTGNIGGKLSDKSKEILKKYIQITNQDKKVLEHIKYEVRK
jgi:hypothetical protein